MTNGNASVQFADRPTSLRSYRSKVAEWGLKQHQSSELLGIVVAKREKRKRDEGKNTVVVVRNEQLPAERLDLFQRRAKDKQSPSAGIIMHMLMPH